MMKLFWALVFCAMAAFAQRTSGVVTVFAIPSGVCLSTSVMEYYATGNTYWGCQLATRTSVSGTWAQIGSSGGVTSVSFTGGLISVATPTTTPAFSVAGTSGGIPYFSSASTWASSALLGANLPVFGGGAGAAPVSGTRSGNTTQVVTTTGGQTSGHCVSIDANGNHIDAGIACAGATGGTSITFGNYAALPATCVHTSTSSDIFFDSPYQFLCTSTNTWTPYWQSIATTLPPASVTWANQQSSTYTQNADGSATIRVQQETTGNVIAELVTSLPATPYTYWGRESWTTAFTSFFDHGGACLYESATNKALAIGPGSNNTVIAEQWTSFTTVAANTQSTAINALENVQIVYAVANDGTNVSASFSLDNGHTFITLLSATIATYFTTAPDKAGLCFWKNNASNTFDFATIWGFEKH